MKKENLLLVVAFFNIILCFGSGFGLPKCDRVFLVPVFVYDATIRFSYMSV